MVFIDDTLIKDAQNLAKILDISENAAAILMDSTNSNARIFVNRKYKNIRRDTSPVSNQILNKKGDDKYYATRQLVMDLFNVSNSSASKMMKLSNKLPKTASSPTSPNKLNNAQINNHEVFFDAPLEEQINVDYVDKEGNPHSKHYDGILLSEVLSKYYDYQINLDFISSETGQAQIAEKKGILDDFKEDLLIQSEQVLMTNKSGKNIFKSPKGNLTTDNLALLLINQKEAYDQLVNQYEKLKSLVAVQKNINPINKEESFEQGPAYEDYKKWLKDNNKQEPEYSLLKQIAEHQKENKK